MLKGKPQVDAGSAYLQAFTLDASAAGVTQTAATNVTNACVKSASTASPRSIGGASWRGGPCTTLGLGLVGTASGTNIGSSWPTGGPSNGDDGAFVDEFPDVVEIGIKVALRTALGGQFVLFLHVGIADHASLFHAIGQRLFAVDVESPIHRPNGNEGVMMVRRADDHGVEVFLVQALTPILVLLGFWELLSGSGESLGIDVAESDDVLLFQHVEMSRGSSPTADKGDI